MKAERHIKIAALLGLVLLGVSIHFPTLGQALVQDTHLNRQLERQVYQRWNRFTPKWYYILFHNRYRKGEDRRVLRQLAPTGVALGYTKTSAEQEKTEVTQVSKQVIIEELSRQHNLTYLLHFVHMFSQLELTYARLRVMLEEAQVSSDDIQAFSTELVLITASIELLLTGGLSQGELAEGLKEIQRTWEQLLGAMHQRWRLALIQNLVKK